MAPPAQRTAGASKFAEVARPSHAVWLADLTGDKFLPITLERPKVLLPVVNKPIIDHTLEWLQSAGVQHVFMVCRAHPHQIRAHLCNSGWGSKPNFLVTLIDSLHDSSTTGDALRFIDNLNVIRGDFVLVSGDIVGNALLTEAFQEHNERRKVDNFALMTMLIEQSSSHWLAHQSWMGLDELYMVLDPNTKQLTYYEERVEYLNRTTSAERKLLASDRSKFWRNNMQDCYIDICSPKVLSLFTHNLNYRHLRPGFVKAMLRDDTMEYKIFTYEVKSSDVNRVDNFRSYASITKAIIERRRCPVLNHNVKNSRELFMLLLTESEINKSYSPLFNDETYCITGNGTRIGNNTKILNSVIGEGCVIGSDVSIDGCYIWNNVTIENGCKLKESLICDGVILKSGAVLNPGVVLSFKVIIRENIEVPAYSKVSLLQEPIKQVSSEEEVECAGQNSALLSPTEDECSKAFVWSVCKEKWRYSVASLPENLDEELDQDSDADDLGNNDGSDDGDTGSSDEEQGFMDDGDEDAEADIEAYENEKVSSSYQRREHKRQKI